MNGTFLLNQLNNQKLNVWRFRKLVQETGNKKKANKVNFFGKSPKIVNESQSALKRQ